MFIRTKILQSTMLVSLTACGSMHGIEQSPDELTQSEVVDIIVACKQTEHDYALFRDRNDPQGFANTFTVDGEWGRSNGRVLKGRKAIEEYVTAAAKAVKDAPEYHMQFNATIQIKPIDIATATGVSYALVLESPIPKEGGPVNTAVGFQVASESRSTYKINSDGCKIARRDYTTFFVDPE